MDITGIIAEFNPFHNGHAYLLQKIKEKHPHTYLLAVMSGSFTQRGDAAILDKWSRARTAVSAGCDLVLELPLVFATSSAQGFAQGGISLLQQLSIVTRVAFGTEFTDIDQLKTAAALADTQSFQNSLHQKIQDGLSYAKAFSSTMSQYANLPEAILRQPNTILALEYLHAILLSNANLQIMGIQRHQASHHDSCLQGRISSASAIRQELLSPFTNWKKIEDAVPPSTFHTLKSDPHFPNTDTLYPALLCKLCTMSQAELRSIAGINEGIENRLRSAGKEASLGEFVLTASGKRYPQSRIRRIVLSVLLNLTKDISSSLLQAAPLYARILAFNERGREILHELRKQSSIPVITKTAQYIKNADCHASPKDLSPLKQMLRLDCIGTDLQEICRYRPSATGKDFLTSPIYLQSK